MTRLHPEERPSKDQVARDLAMAGTGGRAGHARRVGSPGSATREAPVSDRRAGHARAVQGPRACGRAPAPAADRAAERGPEGPVPRTQVDIMSDQMTQNLSGPGPRRLGRDIIFSWKRCTLVAPFGHPGSVTLRMSRSVESSATGNSCSACGSASALKRRWEASSIGSRLTCPRRSAASSWKDAPGRGSRTSSEPQARRRSLRRAPPGRRRAG